MLSRQIKASVMAGFDSFMGTSSRDAEGVVAIQTSWIAARSCDRSQ